MESSSSLFRTKHGALAIGATVRPTADLSSVFGRRRARQSEIGCNVLIFQLKTDCQTAAGEHYRPAKMECSRLPPKFALFRTLGRGGADAHSQ